MSHTRKDSFWKSVRSKISRAKKKGDSGAVAFLIEWLDEHQRLQAEQKKRRQLSPFFKDHFDRLDNTPSFVRIREIRDWILNNRLLFSRVEREHLLAGLS